MGWELGAQRNLWAGSWELGAQRNLWAGSWELGAGSTEGVNLWAGSWEHRGCEPVGWELGVGSWEQIHIFFQQSISMIFLKLSHFFQSTPGHSFHGTAARHVVCILTREHSQEGSCRVRRP